MIKKSLKQAIGMSVGVAIGNALLPVCCFRIYSRLIRHFGSI